MTTDFDFLDIAPPAEQVAETLRIIRVMNPNRVPQNKNTGAYDGCFYADFPVPAPGAKSEAIYHRGGGGSAGGIEEHTTFTAAPIIILGAVQKFYSTNIELPDGKTRRVDYYTDDFAEAGRLMKKADPKDNSGFRKMARLFFIFVDDPERKVYALEVRSFAADAIARIVADTQKKARALFKAIGQDPTKARMCDIQVVLAIGDEQMVGSGEQSSIVAPVVSTDTSEIIYANEKDTWREIRKLAVEVYEEIAEWTARISKIDTAALPPATAARIRGGVSGALPAPSMKTVDDVRKAFMEMSASKRDIAPFLSEWSLIVADDLQKIGLIGQVSTPKPTSAWLIEAFRAYDNRPF